MTNPSTGEVFAVAPHADAAMCDDAVESAIAAGPAWAATPIEERRAKMTEAMEILKAHEQELAELHVDHENVVVLDFDCVLLVIYRDAALLHHVPVELLELPPVVEYRKYPVYHPMHVCTRRCQL